MGVALRSGQSICDLRELLGLPRESPQSLDALVLQMHKASEKAGEDAAIAARKARLAEMAKRTKG